MAALEVGSGQVTGRAAPWEATKEQRRVMSDDGGWSGPLVERLLANCHPKQRDFVLDPADRIAARVGRGRGKTTGDMFRLLIRMFRQPHAQCLFVAETKPHAESLMWEPLKVACDRLGLVSGKDVYFSDSKLRMRVKRTGAILQLHGADKKKEIEKLRGLPFDEAIVDEAAILNPTILEWLVDRIISPRLRGPIVLTSTPYHVLRGYFYEATRPGGPNHRPYAERDDPKWKDWGGGWSSHFWAGEDPDCANIPALADLWRRALIRKAENGWSDNHPIWRREYLGEWSADNTDSVYKYNATLGAEDPRGPEGTLWNRWNPPRMSARDGRPQGFVDLAKACPGVTDWHYAIALDKGNKDPFACTVHACSPQDKERKFRHVWGMEKLGGMYAKQIAIMLIGEAATERMLQGKEQGDLDGILGVTGWPDVFVADADQALLDELTNVYGIKIAKTDRNRDSKVGGIEIVNGDLYDGLFVVLEDGTPGAGSLESQMIGLQWKPDENDILKEDPGQSNHSSDCGMYARRASSHMLIRDAPDAEKSRAAPPARAYTDPQGLDTDDEAPNSSRSLEDLYEDGDLGDRWSDE